MSNSWYTPGNVPVTQSRGSSATIRAEYAALQAAFDKFPTPGQMWGASANYVVAGGAVNAWTATVSATYLTSYLDGMQLRVKFLDANTTTTPTLNLNGLGAKQIVSEQGASVLAGDIAAGSIVALIYNATFGKFQINLGNSVASAAASAAAASASAASAAASSSSAGTSASSSGASATAAAASASAASVSAAGASAAQTAAENARDTAWGTARLYANTTAGLAGTSNGQYFAVLSVASAEIALIYLNSAGSAVDTSKRVPSAALIDSLYAGMVPTTTTYGITTNTSNYPANTNYHGIRATATGTIKNINVNVSASGTGQILVARRLGTLGNKSHQVESITTVTVPVSGVNVFPVTIAVTKGDLVMFAMTAGGGVCFTALGVSGGILISAPIVGTQFNAPLAFTTNQPSISYDLVTYATRTTNDTDIKALKAGTAESFAATTQTLGNVTVGAGTPTGSATSRGPTAQCPAGLLTEVRWITLTASKMIDANIAIWSPASDNTTNFTATQVIAVSVTTDANGLAIATVDDLGPVLVPEGSYVHVQGYDGNTGPVNYTADGRGGTSSGTSNIKVADTASVGWFDVAYAISFTITTSDALTVSGRVDTADRFQTLIGSAVGLEDFKVGILSGGFDSASHSAKGGYIIPRDGTITQFSVDLTAAGTGVLLYLRKINTNRYRIATATPYTTSLNGANLVTGLSIAAKAGDALAYVTLTGGFFRNNSAVGGGTGFVMDTTVAGGLVRVGSAISMGMQFVLNCPRTAPLNLTTKGGRIQAQGFAGVTLPTGWTTSGSWTVNNGLTPPATGGYNVYAYDPQGTSMGRKTDSVRVKVNDTTGACGLFYFSNAGGAMAVVDGTAGQLQIRDWTPSFTSSLKKSVALPAALTAGREYVISVKKDGLSATATFYDTVTQQTCTCTATITDGYAPFTGFPGVIYSIGATAPVFLWRGVDAPLKRWDVRTIVIGDSNAEGSNATLAGATPWAVSLQNNSASGDVLLANQSGEASNFQYRMLNDLTRWQPRYVVLALGTNDTSNFNQWRANMSYAIAQIESLGAEPILVTVIPKTATTVPASMNSDIKGNYFGRYRYIDMASALSTSHDGSTLNAALYVGDGVHMNAAGHAAAYAQVLADAPFLLW